MGEKFCLKWNDFHTNVSSSFDTLRKDRDFCDVSLVSEDGNHYESHKVILSSCSPILKNILRKSKSGQEPFIYLNGIGSSELGLILDYVYRGEVQIYQNQIDNFLHSAKILQIVGLNIVGGEDEEPFSEKLVPDNTFYEDFNKSVPINSQKNEPNTNSQSSVQLNFESGLNVEELERKIGENVDRIEGALVCKICGHKSNKMSNIKQHVETHIDGISIECGDCPRTFRSRDSLRFHSKKFHPS